MLEIFLFFNPIGSVCLSTEQKLLHQLDKFEQEVKVHFVPVLNLDIKCSQPRQTQPVIASCL